MDRRARAAGIRIGVVAVPPEAAQEVADATGGCGIRVILNYTPAIVTRPRD